MPQCPGEDAGEDQTPELYSDMWFVKSIKLNWRLIIPGVCCRSKTE